jgi:large subunit ribosomal protein L10
MARTKTEKKEILDKVKTIVDTISDTSGSMVFVNFHGLKVSDTMQVRRKLTGEKIGFFVAKKTLIRKALVEKNFKGEIPEFGGELALAYGSDFLAPAREIHEFQKKYKNSISILGGIFEGKYMTKEEMTAIALIPPQKTLQAMFVNVINSPIQGFVMALDQIAQKKTA